MARSSGNRGPRAQAAQAEGGPAIVVPIQGQGLPALPPEQRVFDDYMRDVLDIANVGIRGAIRIQGIQTLSDFVGMEENDIKQITTNIRKPGGTVPRPTEDNPNATVADPGLPIGHVTTRRLEMVRFYINHCVRIQRLPIEPQGMTLQRLTAVALHFKNEEDQPEPELPGKIVKVEDVRTNIEDLDSYLNTALGETFLPLAYLVRKDVELPAVDPGFGLPSFHEEMVARGDHQGTAFQRDNTALWNVISHMTHGNFAWSWVSAHERTRSGRAAYQALKQHYLGESYQARIRSNADAILQKTYYDGARSFSFESYITTLQKAFTDLEASGEAVAEERKVRVLLRGITADGLKAAVAAVYANYQMKDNFERAANYLSEANDTLKSAASAKRNVSAISGSTTNKGNYKNGDKGNKKKKQKYSNFMKYSEWSKLSDAQKDALRKSRNNGGKNSDSKAKQSVQQVVTGVATDVSGDTNASTGDNNQSVGAVMTRRNRGNN